MNNVQDYLYHHGILGQKWGKRNGPPYPLSKDARSSEEQKLNGDKYLSSANQIEVKGGGGGGASEEDEEWMKKIKEEFARILGFNPLFKFEDYNDFLVTLGEIGIDYDKFDKDELKRMFGQANAALNAYKQKRLSDITAEEVDKLYRSKKNEIEEDKQNIAEGRSKVSDDYLPARQKELDELADLKKKAENKIKHSDSLYHHGIEGQKWGKRNGPPYPLSRGAKVKKYVKDRLKASLNEHEEKIKKRKAEREEDRLTRRAEKEEDRIEKREIRKAKKAKALEDARNARTRQKSINDMNEEELVYMINRIQLENNFNRLLNEANKIANDSKIQNDSDVGSTRSLLSGPPYPDSNKQSNPQPKQESQKTQEASPEQKNFRQKIKAGTEYLSSVANDLKPVVEATRSVISTASEGKDLSGKGRKMKVDKVKKATEFAKAADELNDLSRSLSDKKINNALDDLFEDVSSEFYKDYFDNKTTRDLSRVGEEIVSELFK